MIMRTRNVVTTSALVRNVYHEFALTRQVLDYPVKINGYLIPIDDRILHYLFDGDVVQIDIDGSSCDSTCSSPSDDMLAESYSASDRSDGDSTMIITTILFPDDQVCDRVDVVTGDSVAFHEAAQFGVVEADASVAIPCAASVYHPQVTPLQRIAVGSWKILEADEAIVILRDAIGTSPIALWTVVILPVNVHGNSLAPHLWRSLPPYFMLMPSADRYIASHQYMILQSGFVILCVDDPYGRVEDDQITMLQLSHSGASHRRALDDDYTEANPDLCSGPCSAQSCPLQINVQIGDWFPARMVLPIVHGRDPFDCILQVIERLGLDAEKVDSLEATIDEVSILSLHEFTPAAGAILSMRLSERAGDASFQDFESSQGIMFLHWLDTADVQVPWKAGDGACVVDTAGSFVSCHLDNDDRNGHIDRRALLTWLDPCKTQTCKHCSIGPPHGCDGGAPCPSDLWCASSESQLGGRESRVQISLEATLPVSAYEGSGDAEIGRLRAEMDECSFFTSLPDGLKVKEATARSLCSTIAEGNEVHWELYVDGSYIGNSSGWAVVLVLVDPEGHRQFGGCMAGATQLDPTEMDWVGAIDEGNISSELTAMVIAQADAVRTQRQVTIRPDLQFSARVARNQESSDRVGKMVDLSVLLECWQHCEICEVRAHKGDPFNELADSLAKWAAIHKGSVGSPPWKFLNALVQHKKLGSLWMEFTPEAYQFALPLEVDADRRAGVAVSNGTSSTEEIEVQDEHAEVSFRVVSANVQSIRDDKKNQQKARRDASITMRLDRQWNDNRYAIVGLQETRTPEGRYRSRSYEIFSTGPCQENGNALFGCEIWIHDTLPLVKSGGRTWRNNDFVKTVVHKDPRRLILVCKGDVFTFAIISLHAPCLTSKTTLDHIREWWNLTCGLITKVKCDTKLVCVDANASVGAGHDDMVGQQGAETLNSQGECFLHAMAQCGLVAPTTWETCHVGDSVTWRHPRGQWMRRDFVLVSADIACWCKASWVADQDTAKSHIDHLPVVLELRGWTRGRNVATKCRLNPMKLRDPDKQREFQAAMQTLPIPSWHVDVDSHCRIWEKNINELAQQVFGWTIHDEKPRRRPRLMQDTLALIGFKRHVLYLMR